MSSLLHPVGRAHRARLEQLTRGTGLFREEEVATAADAPDPDKAARSLRESFQEYLDRRILTIFIFGMASGFPWVLWGSAMTAWLKESGLPRSVIGMFRTVTAACWFSETQLIRPSPARSVSRSPISRIAW